MTEPTTERLAKALGAASAPVDMIERARAGYYDDYKSDLAAPIAQLVEDCRKAGLEDIAQRTIDGEFDGTREEGTEWFQNEGAPLLIEDIKRKKRPKPKGFGVEQAALEPTPEEPILIRSMVGARSMVPSVVFSWGDRTAYFTPQEARANAFAIMKEAANADLDACLMRWAREKAGAPPDQAAALVRLFRQKRETKAIPSCTMHLGDEHIRPDTARQRAQILLDAAFSTEVEVFLVAFLMQDLELSGEVADQLIQEFRAMRGAVTMWGEEGSDRNG